MKMLSNTPPPKDPRELWKHFSDTYFSLRVGLATLAFTFPLVLYLYGKYHGLGLQSSMSAYFWAATVVEHCASFPIRTIFVGFLFAIGLGLYMYKGLTPLENLLLNAAGVCAAIVAIYPERLSDTQDAILFDKCPAIKIFSEQHSSYIHFGAAIALFVLLAIVVWACASKSLEFLPMDIDPVRYRRIYRSVAIGMILFPAPGVLVAFLLGLITHWIFFVEAAGVFTFGLYWFVKSRELALSGLEKDPDEAVQHAARRRVRADAPEAPR